MDRMLIERVDTEDAIKDCIKKSTLKKYRDTLDGRISLMKPEERMAKIMEVIDELYDNFTIETKTIIAAYYNTRNMQKQERHTNIVMNRVWYLTYTQISKAFLFPPNTTINTSVIYLLSIPMRIRLKLADNGIMNISDMIDFVSNGNLFTDIKGIDKTLHETMIDEIAYYIPTITILKLKYSRGNRAKTSKAVDAILKMVKDPNRLK